MMEKQTGRKIWALQNW